MIDHLTKFGQEHLLQFVESLSSEQQTQLMDQIRAIDMEQIQRVYRGEQKTVDWAEIAARAEPPNAIQISDQTVEIRKKYTELGEAALRDSKCAMILVAGGQGTRLGFDQPKGLFPIGPLSNRTLFEFHVDRLIAVMNRYAINIPLLVMTSPATDLATRDYFHQNQDLGLGEGLLRISCQGTMPAVDAASGKILLQSKHEIARSPDGHGGLVAALQNSGCLSQLAKEGIEYLYYAQVDNPLVPACDPFLIGAHIASQSQLTTQVVRKRFAKERVGNVVSVDNQTQIIEYSDLPDTYAEVTEADGSLRFWAGNIAIHVFDRDFLEHVAADGERLPYHKASKAVPFINSDGLEVQPDSPNAIKFEKFVFDLLPMAERSIVVEAEASEVFAPVKNAPGAETDTAATAQEAIESQHRNLLTNYGCTIAPNARVEINPQWALDATDLPKRLPEPLEITQDTYFANS